MIIRIGSIIKFNNTKVLSIARKIFEDVFTGDGFSSIVVGMRFILYTICLILFNLPSWGDDLQIAINEFFPNQIKVYGVKIIGTAKTPFKNIEKASRILNQWLDNNGDGNPDNKLVIDELIKNNAILVMGKSEDDLDSSFENLIDVLEEANIDIDNFERALVGLISDEPNIAYLEEILHLLTQVGYANAYPEVFGEFKGSRISEAMDVARGGYFKTIPKIYPESSWYHYHDKSCDYACMITEYFYWSLTSLLGAQINRYEEISDEWEFNTPNKMTKDKLIMKLLQDEKYQIPKRLPSF